MKSFRSFLSEGGNSQIISVNKDYVDLKKKEARDELNRNLALVLSNKYPNIYGAYVKAAKILRNYGIDLPRMVMFSGNSGEETFVLHQFHGGFTGANLNGIITKPGEHDEATEYYLFFNWYSFDGLFSCSAQIKTEEEAGEQYPESQEPSIERGQVDPRQK